MTVEQLQHRETLLIELLLSSLDARETARGSGSTLLTYLSNLVVEQTHKELEEVRTSMLTAGNGSVNTRIADA